MRKSRPDVHLGRRFTNLETVKLRECRRKAAREKNGKRSSGDPEYTYVSTGLARDVASPASPRQKLLTFSLAYSLPIMADHTIDDRPPSYMSQDSQTSTLIDRPDPPISALLKPNHSTRASRLSYATSQGRYSILEYYELTFALLFSHYGTKKVIVVAVDEDWDTLLKDIQRIFSTRLSNLSNRIKELRVVLPGVGSFGANGDILQDGNMTAMLRYLKSRNGADMVLAK